MDNIDELSVSIKIHQTFLLSNFCTMRYVIKQYFTYIPSASLPPGHFCVATTFTSVAGHVIFHVASCSNGHLVSSGQNTSFK